MRWFTKRDLPYLAIFVAFTLWALVVQDMSIVTFAIIMIIAIPLGLAVYFVKRKAGLIPPPDDRGGR
jgi:hypothetical protein